jgi:hypothetical protein
VVTGPRAADEGDQAAIRRPHWIAVEAVAGQPAESGAVDVDDEEPRPETRKGELRTVGRERGVVRWAAAAKTMTLLAQITQRLSATAVSNL